jgi:bifunctional dethiobiotin synthetase / adenosylmethionine---8-amino-7-oxononanoate aminotransferase
LLKTLQIPRSDKSIVDAVKHLVTCHAEGGGRYALLETAGGVLSPSPSGSQQADLYRPLRLPTLLVGDSKLGGIGTTISAFESLHIRGYDTQTVILFDNPKWGNHAYLKGHFSKFDLATFSIPLPPPRRDNAYDDEQSMEEYYDRTADTSTITEILDLLHAKHFSRISKLTAMPSHAESIIWHPFRQYGLPQTLTAIDSAHGDNFAAYTPDSSPDPQSSGINTIQPSTKPLLTPLIDGSASWWTQGLGHGNPLLSLTAAHAAGRYGHVMFANAVHESALDLAYDLLSTLANPRLSRVFYTDNGSTGMEVAVKMALRASAVRYGWGKDNGGERGPVGVLGISGSYHGDTIGVMNCSEASVFNEKVDWHRPWGFWFDPPTVKMVRGKWVLDIPDFEGAKGRVQVPDFLYDSLEEVFDFAHGMRKKIAETYYKDYITSTLKRLVKEEGRRFGALIMEPVLMGAGGMVFVDPLFQRTLIRVVREDPTLISPNASTYQATDTERESDWIGVPIIADEVFTGLYRLGRGSSSSFLNLSNSTTSIDPDIAPDISVHAKLLTGGLLPLAITTASEAIFDTFRSESKSDALLHGHSYTAHAVGCAVAGRSLRELNAMAEGKEGERWEGYKSAWQTSSTSNSPFSFFAPDPVIKLSHSPKVESVIALGTVIAIALKDQAGSGYSSNAAADLQKTLLTSLDEEGVGVHSRVLGNVLYLMTSLTTERDVVEGLERRLIAALC